MDVEEITGFWEIPGFKHQQAKSDPDAGQKYNFDFNFQAPATTYAPKASDTWLDGIIFGWGEVGENQARYEPSTPSPDQSMDSEQLEYILIGMFGAIVAIFVLCQMVIYFRNCAEKRHTWRIGRRRWWNILKRTKHSGGFKCGGITLPVSKGTVWAHNYDPYESVPCRPGLAYTARPTSLYADLDRPSSSASSEQGSTRPSSRSFSSTTVFMVDPRGHYTSRLSASPEMSLDRERSSSSSSSSAMPAENSSSDTAAPLRPALKRGSRKARMVSTAVQCENPGYDTATSRDRRRPLPPRPMQPVCGRRNSSTASSSSARFNSIVKRNAREYHDSRDTSQEDSDVGNNNQSLDTSALKPDKTSSVTEREQDKKASGERDGHHSDNSLTSVSSMSGVSGQVQKTHVQCSIEVAPEVIEDDA